MFTWPVRVYYEDTDAGGVVYYANYLKFLERARTEWLRELGVDQTELLRERGLIFVIISAEVKYLKPARFNDELCVTATLDASRRTVMTFAQEIYRDRLGGETLVTGRVQAACVDATTFRPRPIPEEVMQRLERAG
jgi:acyl-CoA thioester hydrolase